MSPNIYKRPDKPKVIPVTKRREGWEPVSPLQPLPEPIVVDRATECHVTPPDVADSMVEYLELEGGERVLEPEVGTGNLIAALLAAGHPPTHITGCELNVSLANLTRQRFHGMVAVTQMDFLDIYSGEGFDRIIMNPPFRAVKQHVKAAVGVLKPEGVLVALVPITFDWEGAELMETLPNTTFASAKVNTKIIRIVR